MIGDGKRDFDGQIFYLLSGHAAKVIRRQFVLERDQDEWRHPLILKWPL